MDALIEYFGRDTVLAFVVFIGAVIRAGKDEKIPALLGLVSAFTPFFVVMCILYVFDWILSLVAMPFGITLSIPNVPFVALGGLFAFLGNSWIMGLIRNGKAIEEGGTLEAIISLAKTIVNLKKQP